MKSISRYFSEDSLSQVKKDLFFLLKSTRESNGEIDFQIRPGNKFNLYYKGNSLAEVAVRKDNYQIKIHREFQMAEALAKDPKKRFYPSLITKRGEYDLISVGSISIHACLQKKVINHLAVRIKKVNNGEEIAFEQSLITDNLDRPDFLIIDRQVCGGGIPGIIDLLALKKNHDNRWSFVVVEVKLGNNKELSGSVYDQLDRYVKAIRANFPAFKECYEKNYIQKKELRLLSLELPDNIEIDNIVNGMIVVGSYSKIGERAIRELSKKHPDMEYHICQFSNLMVIC
ncbi:MAG: hypothetical protein KKE09_19520 [Bacteroidetes bacterium]|nr:hypothetical protein [Bacteroidota bacterium]